MTRDKYSDIVIMIISLVMAIYHLIYTQRMLIGPIEHQNLHYAFALVLVYLSLIFHKKKDLSRIDRVALYSLILLSIIATTYVFINFTELIEVRGPRYKLTNTDIVIGIILIFVGLEATRRTFGIILPMVAIVFILYAYFGHYFSGPLQAPVFSVKELVSVYAMALQGGLYGLILGVSANYIFLFVLFAGVLGATGAGRFYIRVGSLMARKLAGGPAISGVVSSAFMGSIVGSAMANVATTGAFTIPLMKKVGYRPHQAGAIEAAASTGGQIMPPIMGAAAFVMAEMTETPYVTIMGAALIPAILYFFSVGIYAQLQAKKMRMVSSSEPMESGEIKSILADAPLFIIPLTIIIVLLVLRFSPMFSVFWAMIALLAMAFSQIIYRREKNAVGQLISGFVSGATNGAKIAVTCAVLGIAISTMNQTLLSSKLAGIIALWCQGSLILALVITMIACVIIGMGAPTMGAYVLVALIGAPVLVDLGVPILSAHMFVFIFACFSAITPPIATAAIPAAAIAQSGYLRTAFESSKVGIVGFIVPYLVVFSPCLMLRFSDCSILQGTLTLITSIIAVASLAFSIVGYCFRTLNLFERCFTGFIALLYFSFVFFKLSLLSIMVIVLFVLFLMYLKMTLKRKVTASI